MNKNYLSIILSFLFFLPSHILASEVYLTHFEADNECFNVSAVEHNFKFPIEFKHHDNNIQFCNDIAGISAMLTSGFHKINNCHVFVL